MNDTEPCATCGSPVTIARTVATDTVGEAGPRTLMRRTCTNDSCPTHGPARNIGETV